MANYRIQHACGHTQDHNLTGTTSKREWMVSRIEMTLCTACYEVEQQRLLAESTAKAATEAKETGLPVLEGSEKQIAWAESLRAKRVKQLVTLREDYADAKARNSDSGDRRAARYEPQIKAIEELLNSNSAKAFIDANQKWEF